jgi:flagellar basal body L-ring protein FlgH
MPQGIGTYGSKKGRPPKKKKQMGKPPGMLKKINTGNPFSAGASTTKKKAMPAASKKTAGKQKLAAMYGDPKKITRGDIITAAKMKKKTKKA